MASFHPKTVQPPPKEPRRLRDNYFKSSDTMLREFIRKYGHEDIFSSNIYLGLS
jgi:hypothetical protein